MIDGRKCACGKPAFIMRCSTGSWMCGDCHTMTTPDFKLNAHGLAEKKRLIREKRSSSKDLVNELFNLICHIEYAWQAVVRSKDLFSPVIGRRSDRERIDLVTSTLLELDKHNTRLDYDTKSSKKMLIEMITSAEKRIQEFSQDLDWIEGVAKQIRGRRRKAHGEPLCLQRFISQIQLAKQKLHDKLVYKPEEKKTRMHSASFFYSNVLTNSLNADRI